MKGKNVVAGSKYIMVPGKVLRVSDVGIKSRGSEYQIRYHHVHMNKDDQLVLQCLVPPREDAKFSLMEVVSSCSGDPDNGDGPLCAYVSGWSDKGGGKHVTFNPGLKLRVYEHSGLEPFDGVMTGRRAIRAAAAQKAFLTASKRVEKLRDELKQAEARAESKRAEAEALQNFDSDEAEIAFKLTENLRARGYTLPPAEELALALKTVVRKQLQ